MLFLLSFPKCFSSFLPNCPPSSIPTIFILPKIFLFHSFLQYTNNLAFCPSFLPECVFFLLSIQYPVFLLYFLLFLFYPAYQQSLILSFQQYLSFITSSIQKTCIYPSFLKGFLPFFLLPSFLPSSTSTINSFFLPSFLPSFKHTFFPSTDRSNLSVRISLTC